MSKIPFVFLSTLALVALSPVASASDRDDDVRRIDRATQVFEEIMSAPDKGIPHNLLESAKCIAIIPGQKKGGFIVAAEY